MIGGRPLTAAGKYLLVLALIVLVAVGGGTTVWTQGLLLAIAGLWMMLKPPSASPSRRLDWMLLLLTVWSLTAFLPNGLLGGASWRQPLAAAGLDFTWMATPQPWVTTEAVLLLIGGISWFYLIWNAEPSYEDRRRLLWVLTLGITVLAVGQICATYYNWRSPFQAAGLGFSYFPNKNQTGLIYAMGGSIAFGLTIHLLRCRRRSALIALLCLLICFAASVFVLSRAAILLFFAGCLIAYLTAFNLRGAFRMMRFVLPIIIVGMTFLLVMGRESLQRFAFWKAEGSELRLDIYRDTLSMVTELPASGLTLGNFAWVFPQFREQVQVAQSVIHPESDWLWLLSELGPPGLAIMALAVIVVMSRFLPFGEERSVPYRAPAFGALTIFLMHSFFDVPAHRFGTLLIAFFVYRLAAAPIAKEPLALLPRWSLRIQGVLLLASGAVWFLSDVFSLPWTTKITNERARETLAQNFSAASRERIEEALDDAIGAFPLDWQNYTIRARYRLAFERDAQGASSDFVVARTLEPNSAEVPFQEGVTWMQYSPRQAAQAWREALNRHAIVPESLYREILDIGGSKPQFARELNNLSIVDPGLRYYYLKGRSGRTFDETIYYERSQDPTLARFTPEQRRALLRHWAMAADGAALRVHLVEHPNLSATPWFYEGLTWAANDNYERAVDTVQPYVTIPRFPEFTQFAMSSENELRQAFLLNPDDVVRGSILLQRQVDKQDWEGARETAGFLVKSESVPDYAYFWKGELDRRAGFSKNAWEAWLPYMEVLVEERAKAKQAKENSK